VHGNLTVVGDPDQCIYSRRHADARNVRAFFTRFPKHHVVYLHENYRSTGAILRASSALMDASLDPTRMPRHLTTRRSAGNRVFVWGLPSAAAEARCVVRTVRQLCERGGGGGDGDKCSGSFAPEHDRAKGAVAAGAEALYPWSDVAILCRSSAAFRILEQQVLGEGLRCRVVGGVQFAQRKEVRERERGL
jgi:DNA helicase-2/ATP-dependent DNA helicase PcrA